MAASEVIRQTLRTYFSQTDGFIADSFPKAFRRLQVGLRRRIETTIAQLIDQFSISRVREGIGAL